MMVDLDLFHDKTPTIPAYNMILRPQSLPYKHEAENIAGGIIVVVMPACGILIYLVIVNREHGLHVARG
jgi:hypothetical protein